MCHYSSKCQYTVQVSVHIYWCQGKLGVMMPLWVLIDAGSVVSVPSDKCQYTVWCQGTCTVSMCSQNQADSMEIESSSSAIYV